MTAHGNCCEPSKVRENLGFYIGIQIGIFGIHSLINNDHEGFQQHQVVEDSTLSRLLYRPVSKVSPHLPSFTVHGTLVSVLVCPWTLAKWM